MKIAYFINQYPKVSHSFIRREIVALEAMGFSVDRFALRGWADQVVDAEDVAEQAKTAYVLAGGILVLLRACFAALLASPLRFLSAFRLSCRVARYSDRSLLKHWITLAEAAWLKQRLSAGGVQHAHAHFGTNSAEVVMLCHALGGGGLQFYGPWARGV